MGRCIKPTACLSDADIMNRGVLYHNSPLRRYACCLDLELESKVVPGERFVFIACWYCVNSLCLLLVGTASAVH